MLHSGRHQAAVARFSTGRVEPRLSRVHRRLASPRAKHQGSTGGDHQGAGWRAHRTDRRFDHTMARARVFGSVHPPPIDSQWSRVGVEMIRPSRGLDHHLPFDLQHPTGRWVHFPQQTGNEVIEGTIAALPVSSCGRRPRLTVVDDSLRASLRRSRQSGHHRSRARDWPGAGQRTATGAPA